jgi:hypothetical protein
VHGGIRFSLADGTSVFHDAKIFSVTSVFFAFSVLKLYRTQ